MVPVPKPVDTSVRLSAAASQPHSVRRILEFQQSVFMGQAPLLKPDPDAQWKPLSCTVGHSPGVQVGADTLSSGGVRIFYMQMMSMYGKSELLGHCLHTDGDQLGKFEFTEQCLHADSEEVRNFELIEHCLHTGGYKEGDYELMEHCLHTDGYNKGNFE